MATTADIQKFVKNSNGCVEYFIKVVYKGKEWAIRKRYSDFLRLNEFLLKRGIVVNYDLPQKIWWTTRYDTELLYQRLKGLQSYLNVLLKTTG